MCSWLIYGAQLGELVENDISDPALYRAWGITLPYRQVFYAAFENISLVRRRASIMVR